VTAARDAGGGDVAEPTITVAFFDLDSTLLDCNSGRLWMQSELRAGRISWRDAVWASWWLVLYRLGRGDVERPFIEAVATLAGQEEAVLDARTTDWFASEVAHRLRPGAAETMAVHRAEGARLVLATSSSVYAARCAREAFALDDAIATSFEVEDGRFTGRVGSFAFGPHKLDRVREWADREGFDLAAAAFYTDSVTDLDLMEVVGEPVAVNPDRKLAAEATARGWRIVDWGRSG
jgi:HAD superfamily hydrolase (TIGR01490 family)